MLAIDTASAPVPVPQDSILAVRVAGDDKADDRRHRQGRGSAMPAISPGRRRTAPIERRLSLQGDAGVAAGAATGDVALFRFSVIPDTPPTIASTDRSRRPRGAMTPPTRSGTIMALTAEARIKRSTARARPLYDRPEDPALRQRPHP